MSDLDRILRPFEPFLKKPWMRRVWGLLLAGAPLALALGFWIHEHRTRGPGFRMMVDRARAIEAARQEARRHGLDAEGWREHVRFEIRPANLAYFRSHDPGPQMRARRFLPEAVAQVLLIKPDFGLWLRADVGPRGFVTDLRIGGGDLRAPAELPAEEASRAAAEEELKAWAGGMAVRFLGEPEASITADAGVAGVRRYTWRLEPRNAPGVELVMRIDVLGDRIVGRSVQPDFAPEILEAAVSRPAAAADSLNAMRLLLIVFLVLYACYRYTRRTIEHEAPHGRALLLMACFTAASLVLAFADPDTMGKRFDAHQFTAGATAVRWALLALTSALVGAVLGIAYGAGESELREGWPGKITSLDAVLTGRLYSANTGVAVVAGLAWACWLFCGVVLARAGLDAGLTEQTLKAIGFTFGRWPMLELFTDTPLQAVSLSVFVLLAPLAFLRRHARHGAVRVALLAAIAVLLSYQGQPAETFLPEAWIESCAAAAAVLLAFFTFDYLAAVMAAAGLNLLLQIAALMAAAPSWRERLDTVALTAAALALPAASAAWLGRRYTDEEVRPAHARRLAERLGLEAELAAAREAQRMLLPATKPELPGLAIAAVCRAAQDVGGDFYDFYARPDGRLCVVVAEGGSDGLASAMTIALAKGFLMHENAAGARVEEALLRLERELGGVLHRSGEKIGFGMALVDPATGALEVARAGAWPRIFIRRRHQAAFEPALPVWRAGMAVDAYRTRLEPGDAVLICTDGIFRLATGREERPAARILESLPSEDVPALQRWLENALAALGAKPAGAALEDDLTAVLFCLCPRAEAKEAAA
ncbi:MAG: SpoIIE family protein phosphatase [Bryobacteraceae bacterium]|nr:SpoIIE family protein phosphatase [Bryobacteraceae bacterium]